MRRLDQSFDRVPEVGELEVAWKKIQVILNDRRPMDDKVLAIMAVLEKMDAELAVYHVLRSVLQEIIVHNSRYRFWLAELPRGLRALWDIAFEQMFGARESGDSYKSAAYLASTQSQWLQTQTQIYRDDEASLAVANIVEACIRQERVNIDKLTVMRLYLLEYTQSNFVSNPDKAMLQTYLQAIENCQMLYANLHLEALLQPNTRPLSEVVQALQNFYLAPQYQVYLNAFNEMLPAVIQVNSILPKYTQISSELRELSKNVLSQQNSVHMLDQHKLLLQQLQQTCLSAGLQQAVVPVAFTDAVQQRAIAAGSFDFYQLIADVQQPAQRERKLIADLLLRSLQPTKPNRSTQAAKSNPAPLRQMQQAVTLQHILCAIYPQLFVLDHGKFKASASNTVAILARATSAGGVLDLSSLAAADLKKHKTEPAFVLLRAVKPIDATFSIVDKIDALHDVMVCINTRGMRISEQSEIEQLQVLAEYLLNFVITWLSTHPQDDTQALHDAMQGIAQLIRPQTVRNLLGQMTPLQERYKAFYNQGPASTRSPAGLLLTAAGELPAGSTQTEPANTRRLAKSISVLDQPSAPEVTVPAPTDDRNVDALADLEHVELVLQEIQIILNDRMALDGKMHAVFSVLKRTHAAIGHNDQACAILARLLAHNTTYQMWLQQLSKGAAKLWQKSIQPMFASHQHLSSALSPASKDAVMDPHVVRQSSAEPLASELAANQAVLRAVADVVVQERSHITKLIELRLYVLEYVQNSAVTPVDKQTLQDYLQRLEQVRRCYGNLQLERILPAENRPVEQTVAELQAFYLAPAYQSYVNALNHMLPEVSKVMQILPKYAQISPEIKKNVQTILWQESSIKMFEKQQALLQRLSDSCDQAHLADTLVSDALTRASYHKARANGLWNFYLLLSGSNNAQQHQLLMGALLRKALSIDPPAAERVEAGATLEQMLCVVLPNSFMFANDTFTIKGRMAAEIQAAIGEDNVELNPKKFVTAALKKLHNEPAGVLLSVIKPIDSEYTLLAKIDSFHDLIALVNAGKIKLSDQSKSAQVQDLAESLLDFVCQWVAKNPVDDTNVLREQMKVVGKDLRQQRPMGGWLGRPSALEEKYDAFCNSMPSKPPKPSRPKPLPVTTASSSTSGGGLDDPSKPVIATGLLTELPLEILPADLTDEESVTTTPRSLASEDSELSGHRTADVSSADNKPVTPSPSSGAAAPVEERLAKIGDDELVHATDNKPVTPSPSSGAAALMAHIRQRGEQSAASVEERLAKIGDDELVHAADNKPVTPSPSSGAAALMAHIRQRGEQSAASVEERLAKIGDDATVTAAVSVPVAANEHRPLSPTATNTQVLSPEHELPVDLMGSLQAGKKGAGKFKFPVSHKPAGDRTSQDANSSTGKNPLQILQKQINEGNFAKINNKTSTASTQEDDDPDWQDNTTDEHTPVTLKTIDQTIARAQRDLLSSTTQPPKTSRPPPPPLPRSHQYSGNLTTDIVKRRRDVVGEDSDTDDDDDDDWLAKR